MRSSIPITVHIMPLGKYQRGRIATKGNYTINVTGKGTEFMGMSDSGSYSYKYL
jgi:hypothetical protein